MKTICPHCNQIYPELPDSYQGMTIECIVCKKQFVCTNLQTAPQMMQPQMMQPQMMQPQMGQQMGQQAPYGSYPHRMMGYPPKKNNVFISILAVIGGVLALLGITAAVIYGVLEPVREMGRRTYCSNNLKQIGSEVLMYTSLYQEYFPADLQTLRTNEYSSDKEIYICPSAKNEYIYLGKGLTTEYAIDNIPIVIEYSDYHDEYVNILYANGAVYGRKLSRNYKSCVDLLNDLHPELANSKAGRIVLENARQADSQ